MTPTQFKNALRTGSAYAKEHGRPDRNRIVLSPGTIIDAVEVDFQDQLCRVIDMNGAIVLIDVEAVIVVANGLAAPDAVEIDVQGGELDVPLSGDKVQ